MGKFGLLGEKLGHSYSPQIHAMLGEYEYTLIEKTPSEVEEFLKNGDFDGLNVTIPYKKTVIPFCAELSDTAAKIGSVNTIIKRPDGTLFGHNTDYYGFAYLLDKTGVNAEGKKAVILGSGGASVTVRAVLADRGASELVTVSRSGADNYANIEKHSDAKIIVNTTPVGMYPNCGVSPVDLGVFPACEAVIDVIYNPSKTELLLQAEDRGIPCAGGLYMLTAQAKRASELFLGIEHPDTVIDTITETIERESKNIVLIGMPGCGKSSAGRYLAELTGRDFFDCDELIITRTGKPIERIFTEDGEDFFRDAEHTVLAEVSAKSGCVIATGGGVVKRENNRRLLRQNNITVFIDRAIDDLPTDGRPLSVSQGVGKLFEQRLPLYLEWSDYKIAAGGSSEETAVLVKEALGL